MVSVHSHPRQEMMMNDQQQQWCPLERHAPWTSTTRPKWRRVLSHQATWLHWTLWSGRTRNRRDLSRAGCRWRWPCCGWLWAEEESPWWWGRCRLLSLLTTCWSPSSSSIVLFEWWQLVMVTIVMCWSSVMMTQWWSDLVIFLSMRLSHSHNLILEGREIS